MDGFDLIIFDCDGVLVDSEIIAADVESTLLTQAGYPISIEEMGERFAGMTWQNILLQVEREASIPISASLLDKSEKLLDMRLEKEVQAIAGVEAALARLDLKRCICSNSSSARLDMMLGKVGLGRLFAPNIFSAKDLGAWRAGRTGYPLVDAGMRQLWATGWMHNRVRMVVASFLTAASAWALCGSKLAAQRATGCIVFHGRSRR